VTPFSFVFMFFFRPGGGVAGGDDRPAPRRDVLPEGALATLRDALTVVQSTDVLPEDTRRRLENEVRNQIGATERLEDRVNMEKAEQYRIFAQRIIKPK